jgi:hypothetical protein
MVLLVLLGLIAAGIAVAWGMIWFMDYQQTHWTPDEVWVRLTVFSGVTIAALMKAFREHWGRLRFWATFLGVMSVRTVLYVALLRRFPVWSLIQFALVTTIEVPALLTGLFWLNYTREEVGLDS